MVRLPKGYTPKRSRLWLPQLWLPAAPWKFNPCSSCCYTYVNDCDCIVDTATSQYQISVTGVTDDGCADCDESVNGTFILDYTGGGSCRWVYDFGAPLCGKSLNANFTLDIVKPAAVRADLSWSPGGGGILRWLYTFPADPADCSSFTMALDADTSAECDGAGSSVAVTAL